MSLLEVLIALAIFLAAMTAISQLVATGSQAAIGAQHKAEAARRCESIMAEAVAGSIPLQSASATPFNDDTAWNWSLIVSDGPQADLLQIEAVVVRNNSQGQPQIEFNLVRWLRDPELFQQSATQSTSSL